MSFMLTSLFQNIRSLLQVLIDSLGSAWRQLRCDFSNLRRRIFISQLSDYAVITLNGSLEERNPDVPWYYEFLPTYRAPVTLEGLGTTLRRLAMDPDVQGVVFLCKTPSLSLAQAQSLTALLGRFRQWDRHFNPISSPKKIIFHLENVNTAIYVAACAADQLLITPLTTWDITGLRAEPLFLRDALAKVGVSIDVVRVAPWKNAMDQYTHNELSDEARAQYNWLLQSWYEDIVAAISAGRHLPAETVRQWIDGAPWTADKTLAAGLVDGLLYEDQLPALLGSEAEPATLKPYAQLRNLLYRLPQSVHEKSIGVISLEGGIMPGESREFPLPLPIFGERTAGSSTIQQLIRAARKDESLAAVILHVDSPGGSALASDLMARELQLLAAEKPLVIFMGDVAASGGYYVATPGQKIVAQRATLTGSIGVFSAKPVTGPTYDLLGAHRTVIQRGQHAGIYSESSAWSPSERAQVEALVQQIYAEFTARVSEGRHLPKESLDGICSGRVWTGAQAKENGLVDEIGDFEAALALACQLGKLPNDGSVSTVRLKLPKRRLLSEATAVSKEELSTGLALLLSQRVDRLLMGQTVWMLTDGLPKVTNL